MAKKFFLLGILLLMFISISVFGMTNIFGLTNGTENVINGDFANGTTNWIEGFNAPGAGSISVSNGELLISITDGGTATWNVQINQGSINLISGTKYTFSFDARSIADRTIEANVGMSGAPYTSYFASGPLSLSTDMTTHSFTFTATANDPTARVEFNCGLDANDVYIDNVSLIGGPAPTPMQTLTPEIINFPDKNLEAAVRGVIKKVDGPIYNNDVNTLTTAYLATKNITDITGLENFIGLTKLPMGSNNISNLTPLANLTNLRDLTLGAGYLSDVSALKNLTNLTRLNLVVNDISDVSPLGNLTNLTELLLEYNNLTDITALGNLTKVTNLSLNYNNINDITPLANCTNLTQLNLSNNKIADITPLAKCTKLTDLNLCGNPISDITALGNLTNLKNLSLNVEILKDISPLAKCTKLTYADLDLNSISDITPLANLTNLNQLSLIENPLNYQAQAVIDKFLANGTTVQWTTIDTSSTPTPVVTPTATPIVTPTATPVVTPTATPVVTPTVTPVVSPTATPAVTPVVTPTGSASYTVSYVIQNSWSNGATVDLTVSNNASTAINGWTLTFSFPGDQEITSLWCGTYTQSGANVTIKDAGWNATIPSKESVQLGFQISSSKPTAIPASFTLTK